MTSQTGPDAAFVTWRKSTFSGPTNCVEVGRAVGHVAVRDSKNPEGSALLLSSSEWSAFLEGAKRGEFDLA